jgi:hypothetical protein
MKKTQERMSQLVKWQTGAAAEYSDKRNWHECPFCGEMYYAGTKIGPKVGDPCLHKAIKEIDRLAKRIIKMGGKP